MGRGFWSQTSGGHEISAPEPGFKTQVPRLARLAPQDVWAEGQHLGGGLPSPSTGRKPHAPCLWPGPSDGTVLVSFSPGVPLAPGLPLEGQEGNL